MKQIWSPDTVKVVLVGKYEAKKLAFSVLMVVQSGFKIPSVSPMNKINT